MSDKNISQLTSLDNTTVAADDLLPIVDVSETGIARSKKITLQNLQDSPIAAISASITATAVDVFVYDTRKDSDGGAWRKRTQHTSWYNETLNTATRGSRREFPAVAVIVAESNKVTIYDGDDPAMPMWMVFNGGGNGYFYTGTTSVSAYNGVMVGGDSSTGAKNVNFVADGGMLYFSNTYSMNDNIAKRNTYSGYTKIASGAIVNNTVNDVAMTVLPNAPIDAATGLPIPTIAVATNGGVSVIKDDGTVVDITSTKATFTDFSEDTVVALFDTGSAEALYRFSIPQADQAGFTPNLMVYNNQGWSGSYQTKNANAVRPTSYDDVVTYGTSGGVINTINTAQASVASSNLQALVSSTYNSGWLPGDIKGAWLSDTDATNVTGAELVTNGTFDTDTSGWTASAAILTIDTQRLKIDSSGNGYAYQAITCVIGKHYTIAVDFTAGTTTLGLMWIGTSVGGGQTAQTAFSANGVYQLTFVATQTTHYIRIGVNSPTASLYVFFDNISVRLADADRSVNNKGLQVFGTVTKSPVATGADLVAYSGFSASNYLRQPYNSDLNVGTGDICVMGWAKNSGSLQRVVYDRHDISTFNAQSNGSTNRIYLVQTSSEEIDFTLGSTNHVTTGDVWTNDGIWHQVVCLRRNGIVEIWFDGKLKLSQANTSPVNADDQILVFGTGVIYPTAPWAGSLALWRFSATAPSPEQIKKIYEDEKVLFQEGAQATLYGTSDAVTALAYDSDENLLRVGTSAGRSDFSGLRRVSNTTTAITTAISSSNGMVVAQ